MKKTELISLIKEELKEKLLKENLNILDSQPQEAYNLEDQIGNFWIVTKAIKESTEDDLIKELDVFGLAEMLSSQGLTKENIVGLYKSEGKARTTSRKLLKQRDSELKEDIKTGSSKVKELEDKIAEIKLEIQSKTTEGISDPGKRSAISSDINTLYDQLDKFEELLKRLKSSLEKEKPSKEKPEEKPKNETES